MGGLLLFTFVFYGALAVIMGFIIKPDDLGEFARRSIGGVLSIVLGFAVFIGGMMLVAFGLMFLIFIIKYSIPSKGHPFWWHDQLEAHRERVSRWDQWRAEWTFKNRDSLDAFIKEKEAERKEMDLPL